VLNVARSPEEAELQASGKSIGEDVPTEDTGEETVEAFDVVEFFDDNAGDAPHDNEAQDDDTQPDTIEGAICFAILVSTPKPGMTYRPSNLGGRFSMNAITPS